MNRIDLKTRRMDEPREWFHVKELSKLPSVSCPYCGSTLIDPPGNPFENQGYCYKCGGQFTYKDSPEEQSGIARALLKEFYDHSDQDFQVSRLLKIQALLKKALAENEDVDDAVLLAYTDQWLVRAYEKIGDCRQEETYLQDLLQALKQVIHLEGSLESIYLYALNVQKLFKLKEYMHQKQDIDLLKQSLAMLEEVLDSHSREAVKEEDKWLKEKLELAAGMLCLDLAEVYQKENEGEKAMDLYVRMFEHAFKKNQNYEALLLRNQPLIEKLKELILELMKLDRKENRPLLVEMLESFYQIEEERFLRYSNLEAFYKQVDFAADQLIELKEFKLADQMIEKALAFEKKELDQIHDLYDREKRDLYLLSLRHANFAFLFEMMHEQEKARQEMQAAISVLDLFPKLLKDKKQTILARGLQAFYYRDLGSLYLQKDPEWSKDLHLAIEMVETILQEGCFVWVKKILLALEANIYFTLLDPLYQKDCEQKAEKESKRAALLEQATNCLEKLAALEIETIQKQFKNCPESLLQSEIEKNLDESSLMQWAKEGNTTDLFNDYFQKVLGTTWHYTG